MSDHCGRFESLRHYRFTDREVGGAETSKSMAHKFKIGQMVNYRPGRACPPREQRSLFGYRLRDGQPVYRIKHFSEKHHLSEKHHRVAQESELAAV